MKDLKEHPLKKSKQKPIDRLNTYAKFSGIAFQMIVIIGLGTYVGLKLDEKYPNELSLFTIALSLISVIITMFYVIKQATNTTRKKTKK